MMERYDDIVKYVLVSEEEIAEITKKLAEKISAMLAIKDIKDYRKFADYSFDLEPFNVQNEHADIFKKFIG